jgi:hypothetical protein
MANGEAPEAVTKDAERASSLQQERNGKPWPGAHCGWPTDRCGAPGCEGAKLCEEPGCGAMHPNGCSADRTLDGWRCGDPRLRVAQKAPRSPSGELQPWADAVQRAQRWALDWLDVYGAPTALWELLLRFAALVAMRPGERRRLDELHTVGLFESEPGAMLWGDPPAGQPMHGPIALVLPFGASAFGRPLPEGEVAELEALLRGAIQRVEALGAEADLFRHAAGLVRGDGFSDRWTAGADFRDVAGVPLDAPHPDAYRVSLLGAVRQAWAERGGAGSVPSAYLRRLLGMAAGRRCVASWDGRTRADLLVDVLRTVNEDPNQTAKGVIELLTRAALAAEAEAESEVL